MILKTIPAKQQIPTTIVMYFSIVQSIDTDQLVALIVALMVAKVTIDTERWKVCN